MLGLGVDIRVLGLGICKGVGIRVLGLETFQDCSKYPREIMLSSICTWGCCHPEHLQSFTPACTCAWFPFPLRTRQVVAP